ncbi:MAG: hypothetical protein ACR2HJ_04230 [Fimbriimonadales bacterium]
MFGVINGDVEVYEDREGAGFHSEFKSVSSSKGTDTFQIDCIFSGPIDSMSIWGGDEGTDTDSFRIDAYDAEVGGVLVDRDFSIEWDGNPYEQLTVSAESIFRVELHWTGPELGIAYDDLEFNPVPEPATWAAPGSLGLLAWLRRTAVRR